VLRRLAVVLASLTFAVVAMGQDGCETSAGGSGGGDDGGTSLSGASDVDCAGGTGDGPRYVQGPVDVSGGDPYGLDADGDGTGCE
jgi:resuscitation-promoting factor RpfB